MFGPGWNGRIIVCTCTIMLLLYMGRFGISDDDMNFYMCIDCFLHHMLWQDYRVVLLVPLTASGGLKVLRLLTCTYLYHRTCVLNTIVSQVRARGPLNVTGPHGHLPGIYMYM